MGFFPNPSATREDAATIRACFVAWRSFGFRSKQDSRWPRRNASCAAFPTARRHPNAGNAWLRLIRVDPGQREIRVQTYSPFLDQFDTSPENEFSYAFDLDERYSLIGIPTLGTAGLALLAAGLLGIVWAWRRSATAAD